MLRRLKSFGVPAIELVNLYKTFILPKLTYASPAWSSSLGIGQKDRLERVQKRALKISLGSSYISYEQARHSHNLLPLAVPDNPLVPEQTIYYQALLKFAYKLYNDPHYCQYFLGGRLPRPRHNLRNPNKVKPIFANYDRYRLSPIPSLINALNKDKTQDL